MIKNRLRILRAERRAAAGKGWSQLDVARRAGIASFRYWQIENGYIVPTDEERDDLARVFKTDRTEVFPVAVSA